MVGPPAATLVIWGAKESALIKFRKQWWRTISPIFLHAGILHVLSNGFIQLRIGGYLNRVYGTPKWLFIYFISGIFGNMMSCIFLPDSVGVGSSGAVLGMLSSWIAWIIFRWNKIPPESTSQRNCQLLMVTAAVVATLATSFAQFVDFAAHFGGAYAGFLWGIILLSYELDNERNRLAARVTSFLIFLASFIWAVYTLTNNWHPIDTRSEWENTDDWHKHGF
jgi:membrane associated rhomboid family serine protease